MNFHIGDVLSVTTGCLVSPNHIDGVHRLLDHMTGSELFTHQLPRGCEAAAPILLRQFPKLSNLDTSKPVTGANLDEWLADVSAQYMDNPNVKVVFLDVQPLTPNDYTPQDPWFEAINECGVDPDKITIVAISSQEV